jgi:hypothetical protein
MAARTSSPTYLMRLHSGMFPLDTFPFELLLSLRNSEFIGGQFCPTSAVEQLILRRNPLPSLYVSESHSVKAPIARAVKQSESSNPRFARSARQDFVTHSHSFV